MADAEPAEEAEKPPESPSPPEDTPNHLGLVKVTLDGGKEIFVPRDAIQLPPAPAESAEVKPIDTRAKRSAPSHGSQSSDIKDEPPEYGDMDPMARAALAQKMQLFDLKRSRRLDPVDGLMDVDPALAPPTFEITAPEQGGETVADLKAELQKYHESQLVPAMQSIQQQIHQISQTPAPAVLQQLQIFSLTTGFAERSLTRRSILITSIPPFTKWTTVEHNLRYLLGRANLSYEEDVQSVTQHLYNDEFALLRVILLTEAASKALFQSLRAKRPYWHDRSAGGQNRDAPLRFERDLSTQERFERIPMHVLMHCLNSLDSSPYAGQTLQPDWNVLQIWDPDGAILLAQVSYLPSEGITTCLIHVHPRHEPFIHRTFQRTMHFYVKETLKLIQALHNTMRDSTTTLRPHYQKRYDISNLADREILGAFPFTIRFLTLSDEAASELTENPLAPLTNSMGLTRDILAAADKAGVSTKDYGKAGSKGKADAGKTGQGKGKSKGKKSHTWDNDPPERWRRDRWDDDRDDYDDYPGGDGRKGAGKRSEPTTHWSTAHWSTNKQSRSSTSKGSRGKGSYKRSFCMVLCSLVAAVLQHLTNMCITSCSLGPPTSHGVADFVGYLAVAAAAAELEQVASPFDATSVPMLPCQRFHANRPVLLLQNAAPVSWGFPSSASEGQHQS